MKLRIVIAVMLAIVTAELIWLSLDKRGEYMELNAQYEQQNAAIAEREAEIQQKQQELDGVSDSVQKEQDAILAQMESEIQALDEQTAQVQAQTQQLTEDFDTARLALAGQDEEYSYYIEVYNALKEGLEKVKGYLAGN